MRQMRRRCVAIGIQLLTQHRGLLGERNKTFLFLIKNVIIYENDNKLKLPGQDLHYPVFNKELLTPYQKPPLHQREERPKPNIIDDEPKYEVEEVLKHCKRGCGHQYWIKWKGHPQFVWGAI
jgi:hypothetical protein